MALTPKHEGDLVAFLSYWFGFTELQEIAFELGLGFERFAVSDKDELARGIVRDLQIMGRLPCLIDQVRKRAPEADVGFLPDLGAGCIRHRKLQVLLRGECSSLRLSRVRRALARSFKVPETQVLVVAAVGPRARLLVSLPDTRPSEVGGRMLRPFPGAVVRPFERLDRTSRRAWRLIALQFPPEHLHDSLSPATQWGDVRGQVRRQRQWGNLLFIVGLCALVALGKMVIGPQVPAIRQLAERELMRLVTALLPWMRVVTSVALSAVGLSWLTAVFFALSAVLLRALPSWLDQASRGRSSRMAWLRWKRGIEGAMDKYPRIIGTLLNLLSGTLALGSFSWLTRAPLDGWDLGIEAAIVLVIELAILGWVGHAGPRARRRP